MPCFQSLHESSGANAKREKGAKEGKIYEKLSLAILAKKGFELSKDNSKFCDFAIGREVNVGKEQKFDDVVFRYKDTDNTNNLIFIQIKHKQDDNQIDSVAFSTEASKAKIIGGRDGGMCRDFNLQKYFISYLNVREELKTIKSENLKNGKIKYVAIFTNIGINTEELNHKGFKLKEAPYDIINLFTLKEPISNHCYQFHNISKELHKVLKKSSELHRVAKELAKYVVWKNYSETNILGIDEAPIKYYHVGLEKEVIKKSDQLINISPKKQKMKNGQYYCRAQFRDEFINDDKPGPKQELRDAIFEAIRELDDSNKTVSNDELKSMLKKATWKLVPNFGRSKQNSKTNLPCKWITIKDEDITDFLKCLVFIVNQPRLNELEARFSSSAEGTVREGTALKHVLGKLENAGPEFRKRIDNLFGIGETTKFEEQWIFGEKISSFIEEQTQFINASFIVTAMTLIYESEVMQYGEFIQYGRVIETLDNFLQNNTKILCINTSVTLLSSIKILQYLNFNKSYKAEDGRISVCLDSLKCKENRDCVIKAFESENNSLLIIECRQTIKEQDLEEFYYRLSEIVNVNHSKKIIFVIQQGMQTVLLQKFNVDFQNKRLYLLENDSVYVRNFQPKEDPLTKHVIVFQEQEEKLSLSKLIGIDSFNSYIHDLSQERDQNIEGIIDPMTLFKILHNDKIEIGSKPLGISSLDGAYSTLFEEINPKTLANKLVSQDNNKDYIYIFTGISGLNVEEKVDTLIQYLRLVNEKDKIKNMFGELGSESKIQITDDLSFKDKIFEQVCHKYPDKRISWICVKNKENGIKFILQLFYNPEFYLKRKFKNVVIMKDVKKLLTQHNLFEIFIFYCAKDQEKLIDLLKFSNKSECQQFENNCKIGKIKLFTQEADAEADFQEHCKQDQIVHWLKFEKGQCIWCNSNGSLHNLRMYIDKKRSEMSSVEEDNLINQIKDRKVVIIADDPGMGKTTTLTKLYESKNASVVSIIKSHWVIRINLRDHLQKIRSIELTSDYLNSMKVVINFLSEVDLKLNCDLAKNLLKVALDRNKFFLKPLLLAFDGFDEVLDAEDRNKIISLLKFLRNETAAKLWITTRFHYQQILENYLSTFAVEFDPMNEEAQVAYIKKYLKDRLSLVLSKEQFTEFFAEVRENKRIQKYIEAFLNNMKYVFKGNIIRFIGTPLQLYLMLEGSLKHFKSWIEIDKDENPDFSYLGNDIWEIYKNFINWKYGIYFKKVDIKECARQKQDKFIFNQYNKSFAISSILNSKPKKTLEKFKDIVLSSGILRSQGSSIEFIHATFRDYFAAKLFVHWIKKASNELLNSNKHKYLLIEILKKPDYQLVRTFINIKLKKMIESGVLEESLKQYGKIVAKLLKKEPSPLIDSKGTVLHIAVEEGNMNIVYFLLDSLKEHKEVLKNFLFIRGKFDKTALHLASENNNDEIVRILLEAAEGISDDTLQEFLHLLKDNRSNALDEAVLRSDNIQILKELLNRTKCKLDLLMNVNKKYNSLNLACEYGKEEFVKILLQEFEHDDNSVKQLLLHNDRLGNSLYWAISFSAIVENLLSIAKRMEDNDETLKKLLLPEKGAPPLNEAVSSGNFDIVKMLLNVAKYIKDDNFTLRQLLFNDITRDSALCDASQDGYCEIIKLLLETAANIDIGMLEKLIFSTDRYGENAIHLLVQNGHEEIFFESFKILQEDKYQSIWKEAVEVFENIPLTDRLHSDKTMLLRSVLWNRIRDVKDILDRAKQSNISPDEKLGILLLTVDSEECRCNTLYIACEKGYIDLIKELISYAININDGGLILNELITSPGFDNKTPFEALKDGYTNEIKEIVEDLIFQAKNYEHAADILQDINKRYADLNSISQKLN